MRQSIRATEVPQPRRQRRPDPVESAILVSVDRAAELMSVSRTFAFSQVQKGIWPSVRLGRRVLIPTDGLRQMVSRLESARGVEDGGE